ncbi:MAG TPA: hypothetical protein VGE07_16700 [Herpetosiphonaceae bacterium]
MIANIGAGVVSTLLRTNGAQAAVVWTSIAAVVEGLGGGNEIVGGVWVLLVSWAGLRTGALPKALHGLGIVISGAGLLTMIPVLGELGGTTFGLGLIVWFVWLGIVLLRRRVPLPE